MVVRVFWGTLGMVALVLGVIGIFIPGLPTAPLILLAAACFSRSSKRLNHWLRHHPAFRDLIRNWEEGRRIHRKAKVTALTAMAVGMGLAVWLLNSKPVLLIAIIAIVTCVALYVASRPE